MELEENGKAEGEEKEEVDVEVKESAVEKLE